MCINIRLKPGNGILSESYERDTWISDKTIHLVENVAGANGQHSDLWLNLLCL